MNRDNLTEAQRAWFDQVRREAIEDGMPVATLLLREDMAPRDRAAVAEAFTPGAGRDYL